MKTLGLMCWSRGLLLGHQEREETKQREGGDEKQEREETKPRREETKPRDGGDETKKGGDETKDWKILKS